MKEKSKNDDSSSLSSSYPCQFVHFQGMSRCFRPTFAKKSGPLPIGRSPVRDVLCLRGSRLEDTLSHHGVGDLLEANDVGTSNQVVAQAIALATSTEE